MACEKMQCGAPRTGSPSVEGLSSSLQKESSGLLKPYKMLLQC